MSSVLKWCLCISRYVRALTKDDITRDSFGSLAGIEVEFSRQYYHYDTAAILYELGSHDVCGEMV